MLINAIVEFNKIKEIYETRLRLEQSSKSALELAQLQYMEGVIAYMDLLDAQRGYLEAQNQPEQCHPRQADHSRQPVQSIGRRLAISRSFAPDNV